MEKYLEYFDKIFGTNTNGNLKFDMPLLKAIKENFDEDLYNASDKYKKILKEMIEIQNKLLESFTEEQKQLFKKYEELSNQKTEEIDDQLFMFRIYCSK